MPPGEGWASGGPCLSDGAVDGSFKQRQCTRKTTATPVATTHTTAVAKEGDTAARSTTATFATNPVPVVVDTMIAKFNCVA